METDGGGSGGESKSHEASDDARVKRKARRYAPRITSMDELMKRPNYHRVVELSEDPLGEIITDTSFGGQHGEQCGIKGCRSWHKSGYLVALANGVEINTGNVCGANHFGADLWRASVADLKFQRNVETLRRRIREGKSEIFRYRQQIATLQRPIRDHQDAYEAMRMHMERIFGTHTIEALRDRVKSDNMILRERKVLTADEESKIREIEVLTKSQSDDRFVRVGEIAGIKAVVSYRQLRSLSTGGLSTQVDRFERLEVDALGDEDDLLEHWGKWVAQFGPKLAELHAVHDDCVRFLAPSNLQLVFDNLRLVQQTAA